MNNARNTNSIAERAALAWRRMFTFFQSAWLPPSAQDQAVVRGRRFAKAGDQAQALQAFKEFYSRRSGLGHLIRRRNSNVVFDLLNLADSYPPARDAVVDLALVMEGEIRGQLASDEDISDWCTIIRHLGEFDRAWELYNQLLAKNDARASKLTGVVYARLIAEKRYGEALTTALENTRWTLEEVDPEPKTTAAQTQLFSYWLPAVYEAFEVLLACGATQEYRDLENWAMKITPQPGIYDGLIKAAEKAGNSEVAERLAATKAKSFPGSCDTN